MISHTSFRVGSQLIGDGAVGKMCFLKVVATDVFPTEYIPTIFDDFLHYVLLRMEQ